MIHTYNITYNIKYGADTLQYVNLYIPDGLIEGTVLHIHGGSWQSTIDTPSIINEDPPMAQIAVQGYAVIDVNYRGINTGNGSSGNGQFPNNIDDIVTILQYCNVRDSGNAWSPLWNTIYDIIKNNGGLMVTGTSAGGHLAIMGTCAYGTESGIWPLAAVNTAGPMNLNNTTTFIEPLVTSLVINNYVSPSLVDQASPMYMYGTAASPGPWFTAVNNSKCKFYFVQNNNDTLVTNAMALPCAQNFQTYNPDNTIVSVVTQGPPFGAFNGLTPVVEKGPTPDGTTATLPTTGNSLGDMWIAGTFWVYNEGTYPGDAYHPASINGFTPWFDHNFTDTEVSRILNHCQDVFGGTGCKNNWWRANGNSVWHSGCLLSWKN